MIRIVLEALGVTFSKKARCRALQLPAWNEALGLPRPWDQQWSLRIQQILAYETDLLEYPDLFDGSHVVEAKTRELKESAKAELERVLQMGGAVAAVESAYMKQQLVASNTKRLRAIENGDQTVVGVNAYTEAEPSPLTDEDEAGDPGGRRLGRARSDRGPPRIPCEAQRRRGEGRAARARRRPRLRS